MVSPLVIVDTTTTAKDVLLEGGSWQKLLTLVQRGKVRLVVPEIVVRETARHAGREFQDKQDLRTSVKRLQERVDRLKQLGPDFEFELPEVPDLPPFDIGAFAAVLREQLCSTGAEVPAVPAVSIEDVLQRDLAGRLPFQESGKGFRDTLVWETVLEVLAEADEGSDGGAYFVSDNLADYWQGDSLHPGLAEELPDGSAITIARDLASLLEEAPFIPLVDGLRLSLPKTSGGEAPSDSTPDITASITDAVMTALIDMQGEWIDTSDDGPGTSTEFSYIGVSPYIENPRITWVHTDEETIIWEAYATTDESTYLIHASIAAELEIEGSVYRSDCLEAERHGVSITGFDPDEHYAEGSQALPVTVHFEIHLGDDGRVQDIEVERFQAS